MAQSTSPAAVASDAQVQDSPPKDSKAKSSKAGSRFFKSRYAGLSFVTKNDRTDDDPTTAIEKVRFVPYTEQFQGDSVRVGYLEVKDAKLADRIAADAGVQEISASDFDKATDTERKQDPAVRAAY